MKLLYHTVEHQYYYHPDLFRDLNKVCTVARSDHRKSEFQ